MRFSPMICGKRSQSGVGLIEVLIAVLILAVGLLGIAALQAITLKNVGGSSERTQALLQTYAMMDTLRLQKASAAGGTLNTTPPADPTQPAPTTPPSPDYLCSTATGLGTPGTVDGWLADIKQTVSQSACGRISCSVVSGGTNCTVGVRWNESRATGGTSSQQITTTSRL